MMQGRLPTYVAFGAAGLAVLALGLSFRGAPAPSQGAGETLDLPEMTDVQTANAAALDLDGRAKLREEIRSYLLEEPDVLVEAFQVLEERRVLEEAQADVDLVKAHAEALFDDGFSFVGGNPEGSITVVEFQDYRCGFCKRAHGEVQDLIAEDGDIRLIIKEFPILGADSMATSELAIATLITQGADAYKRISDAFMTYEGPINEASVERLARGALVDIEKAQAGLEDPEVRRRIQATRELGRALNISGTPTFVIGEKIVRGYLPKDEMADVVALSRRVAQ